MSIYVYECTVLHICYRFCYSIQDYYFRINPQYSTYLVLDPIDLTFVHVFIFLLYYRSHMEKMLSILCGWVEIGGGMHRLVIIKRSYCFCANWKCVRKYSSGKRKAFYFFLVHGISRAERKCMYLYIAVIQYCNYIIKIKSTTSRKCNQTLFNLPMAVHEPNKMKNVCILPFLQPVLNATLPAALNTASTSRY